VPRIARIVVVVFALLVFFGLPSAVALYTDWLWYGETGYRSVFATTLGTRLLLGVVAFIITATWLLLNLRVALASLRVTGPILWTGQQGVQIELPGKRQLGRLAIVAAVLVGLPAALYGSSQWMTYLQWRHGVPFGTADPVLGYDVAFYVFTLPFIQAVRGALLALVVLAALGAGALYALSGGLGLSPTGGVMLTRAARRHLALLAAAFLLLLAVGAWLDIPNAMTTPAGIVHGASYADVTARFPVARLLAGVAVIGAGLAVVAVWRGVGPLMIAAGLYLLVSLGGGAYAAAIQRFIVAPNEQEREAPYIQHNIAATRRAFGLEAVEERQLTGDAVLTRADIQRNAPTLRNVRLWDHRPLLDTFGQLQEIRPYYDFVSVDNDRYTINGEYRQIMLSARELNSTALPNRNWINEHLAFTHGYGLTLGPVNQVTQEGLPVLYVGDLPPVSTVDLALTEPSIYFGELSNDYVFVRTGAQEFHYPKGEDNVMTVYAGKAGVPVTSLWRKAAFAMRFRSQQILFTNYITAESRVLFHRRIGERVRMIAPFLWYDEDPYPVVVGGRVVWLQDAYTFSDRYPYSTPAGNEVSYIRNAVKAVVDAYDGTTTFYLADPTDPIAATYQRIFPVLFRPMSEMPEDLRRHVRYPQTLFSIQSVMYTTFHMTTPAVFYNKEDQWDVPAIEGSDAQPEHMEPYYTIMKLPGEGKAEFIQMLPLTPRRKDNLAAWMVARSDGEHYGRLFVYRFPKQKVVFGPRQVVARINQDQVIAPQITLWNQQGSQVIQGTLLVIPIEESLIYVRPLYLRSSGGRIPELKRVIVAYQNQIVMEPTLEAGLERLFGTGAAEGLRQPGEPAGPAEAAAPAPTETTAQPNAPSAEAAQAKPAAGDIRVLAAEARDHYQRAIEAQRQGNWALYGDEIRKLGEVLQRMEDARPKR
jgi:uncharacterized membrane protein (UPF0182 family)